MKAWFRENPTIAFGLGLPLLLVIVFLLVSAIPSLLVAPPQHDVLYATHYYNHTQGVQLTVIDKKVQASYRGNAQSGQLPRLWRYYAKTGAVQEIALILPAELTATQAPAQTHQPMLALPIAVPDLDGVVVDSSSIAPDGYEFISASDRYSGNIFRGLFYSSRHRHQATLSKNGRSIRLPNADSSYYRHSTRFIGWVMTP